MTDPTIELAARVLISAMARRAELQREALRDCGILREHQDGAVTIEGDVVFMWKREARK